MMVDQLKPNRVQRGLDSPEPVKVPAQQEPASWFSIHCVEKTRSTERLCRLNLTVHGLEGDIRHGGQVNSYYDNPPDATGRIDTIWRDEHLVALHSDRSLLLDTTMRRQTATLRS